MDRNDLGAGLARRHSPRPGRGRLQPAWRCRSAPTGSGGERVDHAFDDLYYLERACQAQVLALSTGRPLQPVAPELAARVAAQTLGERAQSELFFRSLRRQLT